MSILKEEGHDEHDLIEAMQTLGCSGKQIVLKSMRKFLNGK